MKFKYDKDLLRAELAIYDIINKFNAKYISLNIKNIDIETKRKDNKYYVKLKIDK